MQEIYYADEAGGNYIVIDHEHDLFVVIGWIDESKMDEFMNLLEQQINSNAGKHECFCKRRIFANSFRFIEVWIETAISID
jgi:hypothetical protein